MGSGIRVTFLLERFGRSTPDRLELTGRWSRADLAASGPPELLMRGAESEQRLPAVADSVRTGRDGRWSAVFALDPGTEEDVRFTLLAGEDLQVELPRPNSRRFGRLQLQARAHEPAAAAAPDPPAGSDRASAVELHASLVRASEEAAEARVAAEAARQDAARARKDAARDRERRLEEQERLLGALNTARDLARQEIADARAANTALQARLEEVTERAESERPARAELRLQIASLRGELEAGARREREQADRLREELERTRAQLETAASESRAEVSPAHDLAAQPLQGLSDAAARLQAEFDRARAEVRRRVAAHEHAAVQARREAGELRRQLEGRDELLVAERAESERRRRLLAARDDEIRRLRAALAAAHGPVGGVDGHAAAERAGAGPGTPPVSVARPARAGGEGAATSATPIVVGTSARLEYPEPVELGLMLARIAEAPVQLVGTYMFDSTRGRTGQEACRQALLRKAQVVTQRLDPAAWPLDGRLHVTALPGAPALRLQEAAQTAQAPIIVLGATQRGRVGAALGSTTMRVLRHAGCAVAVSPPGFRDRGETVARVAVAFADTAEGHGALRAAAALARRTGARLDVVSFLETHAHEVTRDRVELAIERAAEACAEGVDLHPGVLDGGAERLVELSRRVDLMVCGARSPGPLRLVRRLALHAESPVLLVPLKGDEAVVRLFGMAAPVPA